MPLGEFKTLTFAGNDEAGYDIAHYLERGSQSSTGGDEKARSTEREDRLDRKAALHSDSVTLPGSANPSTPASYKTAFDEDSEIEQLRYHTLGDTNSNNRAEYWQAQNDRFYHSVSELLHLPVYGPDQVTNLTAESQRVGTGLAGPTYFLRPTHPSNPNGADATAGTSDDLTNRWYRLLEFLERPSPISREGEIRDPGMMNLNTIRYPASLAGLVDDPYAFAFGSYQDIKNNNLATQTNYMPDATGESGRDWWLQFLMSRDGGYNLIDTDGTPPLEEIRYDYTSGRILPGAPGSMPFRPLSFSTAGDFSLDHTALRRLPKAWNNDATNTNVANNFPARRLFELRAPNETVDLAQPPSAADTIDAYAPYRLYSKVLNNATVRSNTFFVFMQIDYFEVLEIDGGDVDPDSGTTVPSGYVLQKIGRQLDPNAAATPKSQRGFFVIDRSKAFGKLTEENFDGGTNPTFAFWGDRATSNNPVEFDYKSLVVHQHVFQN